jgi:hypothetical protein
MLSIPDRAHHRRIAHHPRLIQPARPPPVLSDLLSMAQRSEDILTGRICHSPTHLPHRAAILWILACLFLFWSRFSCKTKHYFCRFPGRRIGTLLRTWYWYNIYFSLSNRRIRHMDAYAWQTIRFPRAHYGDWDYAFLARLGVFGRSLRGNELFGGFCLYRHDFCEISCFQIHAIGAHGIMAICILRILRPYPATRYFHPHSVNAGQGPHFLSVRFIPKQNCIQQPPISAIRAS